MQMITKIFKKYQILELFTLKNPDKVAFVVITVTLLFLFILSLFRFPLYDERLYLHETGVMSAILNRGEWIGNYGIGVHGFIFKLPVAIIYLLTGPSVFVATSFHIILATLSCYLFYKILRDYLHLRGWAVLGLILFVTNYSFISWSITFHRETPVLFALLLFLSSFLAKKEPLILGFLLVLIFEAKEYVFFAVAASLVIWLILYHISKNKGHLLIAFKNVVKNGALLFTPSVIYLVLMLTTPLVPINMFATSLLGLNTNSTDYQLKHIVPNNYETREPSYSYTALSTYITEALNSPATVSDNTGIEPTSQAGESNRKNAIDVANTAMLAKILATPFGYLEKLFYLSSFSFQSTPVVILIPAMLLSVLLFSNWIKLRDYTLAFLPVFLWVYLGVYLIKVSHQRYLFPVLPMCLMFFIFFLRSLYVKKMSDKLLKRLATLLILAGIIMALYPNKDVDKKGFEVVTSSFFLILLLGYIRYKKRIFVVGITTLIALGTFSAAMYVSLEINQFAKSRIWGINGEIDRISKLLDDKDRIYINETGILNENWIYMVKFYRQDPALRPEWKWELLDRIPKADLLEPTPTANTFYDYPWKDTAALEKLIRDNQINKVVIVASTYGDIKFRKQDLLPELTQQNWLSLTQLTHLKNKDVYIFEVANQQK